MKAFIILLAAFIGIPILEFAILIEVGTRLGTLNTLLLVFGTGLVGAWLARMEGLRILYQIRREMDSGRVPSEQLFDGVLVLIAGIVLITPGLLTDAAGLLLLFPPTRYPIKRLLRRWLEKRIVSRRVQITTL